jgi:hypothetical protein
MLTKYAPIQRGWWRQSPKCGCWLHIDTAICQIWLHHKRCTMLLSWTWCTKRRSHSDWEKRKGAKIKTFSMLFLSLASLLMKVNIIRSDTFHSLNYQVFMKPQTLPVWLSKYKVFTKFIQSIKWPYFQHHSTYRNEWNVKQKFLLLNLNMVLWSHSNEGESMGYRWLRIGAGMTICPA